MPLAATFARAAAAAGHGTGDPLVIAATRHGGRPAHLARGCLPAPAAGGGARDLGPGTLIYMASLAKQVAAACLALLARDGAVDVQERLVRWMPGLPDTIRLRHLIHHTAGLPQDVAFDGPDRTTGAVIAATRTANGPWAPGVAFGYSNVGYVLLGEVVARVAGRSLPEFARSRIFEPLGMTGTVFWTGPQAAPPGGAPLDPPRPAPHSVGDGGLWSTATDMLRWAAALDADELGVTATVQTPGRLDDGTPLGYAWGMEVVQQAGHRVFRHTGSYAGVRTLLVRVPDSGLALVVLAPAGRAGRLLPIGDTLVDALA